jgi:hypothetical protein
MSRTIPREYVEIPFSGTYHLSGIINELADADPAGTYYIDEIARVLLWYPWKKTSVFTQYVSAAEKEQREYAAIVANMNFLDLDGHYSRQPPTDV